MSQYVGAAASSAHPAALPEAPSVCRVTPREGRRHVPCGGKVLTAGTTSMPTALPCLAETPSPLPAACSLTRRAVVCADTAAAVCQCTDRTVRCVHAQRGCPSRPAQRPSRPESLVAGPSPRARSRSLCGCCSRTLATRAGPLPTCNARHCAVPVLLTDG
jgi:hypothetical protein